MRQRAALPRLRLPALWIRVGGGGGYSQSTLLKRTALVAGALTAIVLTAGLFPLSLVGWRWPRKPSGLGGRRLLLSSGTTLLVGAPARSYIDYQRTNSNTRHTDYQAHTEYGTRRPRASNWEGVPVRYDDEEERSLIKDLKRYAQLAVAWDRHGSLVPRWT